PGPGGERERCGNAPLDPDGEDRRTRWVGRSPFEENAMSVVTDAEELRLIAESIPHLVWTAGPDGLIDYFNCQCAAYAGRGVEPTRDWPGEALIHPDDLD